MYNPFSLEGKAILITGASSGIGRACAIECSLLGANVIITGRNEERLNETFNSLSGKGHLKMTCDLSLDEELDRLVAFAPQLNGVVINAGIGKLAPVKNIKRIDLENVLQTNTVSSILLLQKLLKAKKIGKDASVVFTSSMSALGETATGNGIYTASKGAISSFIKVAALELAPRNIRVNAVCPGEVNTTMISGNDLMTGNLDSGLSRYPLGRYGNPCDIAWAMIYLLSNASSWVTGTNLIVDGGLAIH